MRTHINCLRACCFLALAAAPIPVLTAAPLAEPATASKVDAFGDPLPEGAVMRFGTNRFRQPREVRGLVFSIDGKLLFSTSINPGSLIDCRIHIWNAENGVAADQWVCTSRYMYDRPQLSPDGKYLVGGDNNFNLAVCDISRRKVLWEDGVSKNNRVFCCSPDCTRLAIGRADGVVRIVELNSGKVDVECVRQEKAIEAIAFTNEGKEVVAVLGDFSTCKFDARTGKLLAKSAFPNSVPRTSPLTRQRVAFSGDGKDLTMAEDKSGFRVWCWTVGEESAKTISASDIDSPCTDVSMSKDGRFIVTCHANANVRLWGAASGALLRNFGYFGPYIRPVLSPDARRLAVYDHLGISMCDVASGEVAAPERPEGEAMFAALLNGGKTVVTSMNHGKLLAWDPATGKVINRYDTSTNGILAMAANDDGAAVRALDFGWRAVSWDAKKPGEARMCDTNFVSRLYLIYIYSAGGEWVASRTRTEDVGIYDVETNKEVRTFAWEAKKNPVVRIQLSPDRRWLAAGNFSEVRIWEVATGRELPRLPFVASFTFSTDGRLLIGRDKNEVSIWEIVSGRERLRIPHTEEFGNYAISPNHRLILGSAFDGHLIALDGFDGREIKRIPAHTARIDSITFANRGKHFLSVSKDSTVVLWDAVHFDPPEPAVVKANPEAVNDWIENLASPDAAKAANAIRSLVANPDAALNVIRILAKNSPDEAAKRIARLIEQLDHPRFKLREEAVKELIPFGTEAKAALQEAVKKAPSEDARTRMEGLLKRTERASVVPPWLREFRMIETLERIGSKGARDLLMLMATVLATTPAGREADAVLKRWKK